MMNKKELLEYKRKLLNERQKILDTINGMKDHGMELSQREEVDELSVVDNHPGDMGTEMFDKQRRFALLDNEKTILIRIDDALHRIEDGTYGTCELCGKEIDRERLDFMPYANTCMSCESKKPDYNTYRYDRPVEEETLAPFGRYFRDYTEEKEYETYYNAEDAWQDVAKYEKRPGIIRNFDDIDGEVDPNAEPEADSGAVEFTDLISNQQYRAQLPD
jgi:YteA family regulatory protein